MAAFLFRKVFIAVAFCPLIACNHTTDFAHVRIKTVNESELLTHGGITYKATKPFTGKAFELNKVGDTVLIESYYNGKLNGNRKLWFTKGKLMEHRFFKNGKKQGLHELFWPNGKLKAQLNFLDGEYNGLVKEWYENGNKFREFNYDMGYENGSQKMWRIDGSIYANYVVKENRIYGLSGRKNCRNVWKNL